MRFLPLLLLVGVIEKTKATTHPLAIALLQLHEVSTDEVLLSQWNDFKLRHNKQYPSFLEEEMRRKIFASNSRKISDHNQLYEQGVVTYYMEMNHFGDIMHYEFLNYLTYNITHQETIDEDISTFIEPMLPAYVGYPSSMDWRKYGVVTKVKDQGTCGSCWAFASTGALEAQNARKTGFLVSLSEQNLVDCSTKYGNHACNGGNVYNAYKYIKNNKGIDTERSYPYESKLKNCRYNSRNKGATVVGYKAIPQTENSLKAAVATLGPVAVAVDSTNFQFYKGGVFFDKTCSESRINHAVLAIGYGRDQRGGDYWLIKNSWDTEWGEQGYMKLARNRHNHCGVASVAVVPVV